MTRGGSALNLRTSTIRPLFFLKRETNKKGSPWGLPLDALFHYYFVLYTFKGFRDEERMLKTVILLEL